MGIDYSYNVTKVSNVRQLDKLGNRLTLLADIQCEDEHDHAMAAQKDVVVTLDTDDGTPNDGGYAEIENEPDFLADDEYGLKKSEFDALYAKYSKLCRNIGYHAYNNNEFAEMLCLELSRPIDAAGPVKHDNLMTDHQLLQTIQQLLTNTTWTPDTLDQIAQLLNNNGYRIDPPNED